MGKTFKGETVMKILEDNFELLKMDVFDFL